MGTFDQRRKCNDIAEQQWKSPLKPQKVALNAEMPGLHLAKPSVH